MADLIQKIYKIGFSKNRKKLLIESVLLPEHGFNKGDQYGVQYIHNNMFIFKPEISGSRTIDSRGVVFGYPKTEKRKARTIIEINNNAISELFKNYDFCRVTFDKNLLLIEPINKGS